MSNELPGGVRISLGVSLCVVLLPRVAGAESSSASWQSFPVAPPQAGEFVFAFDLVPTAPGTQATIGLASGAVSSAADPALDIQLAPGGNFQATDGDGHTADFAIPISVGVSYRVRLVVRVGDHSFDATVDPNGTGEIPLATNNPFRSAHSGISQIDAWGMRHFAGGMDVTNYGVLPPAGSDGGPDGGSDGGSGGGDGASPAGGDGNPGNLPGDGPGFRIDGTGCGAVTSGGSPLLALLLGVGWRRRWRWWR